MSGGNYSLKSTPNDRFFENLFMETLFTTQSVCPKSAEGNTPKKYFFILSDLTSALDLNRDLYI